MLYLILIALFSLCHIWVRNKSNIGNQVYPFQHVWWYIIWKLDEKLILSTSAYSVIGFRSIWNAKFIRIEFSFHKTIRREKKTFQIFNKLHCRSARMFFDLLKVGAPLKIQLLDFQWHGINQTLSLFVNKWMSNNRNNSRSKSKHLKLKMYIQIANRFRNDRSFIFAGRRINCKHFFFFSSFRSSFLVRLIASHFMILAIGDCH